MDSLANIKPSASYSPPLSSVESPATFRDHLQGELVARIRRNPRYSLRKFAQHLAVDHSRLSKILRGQRPLSPEMIRSMGQRLNLDPALISSFERIQPARRRARARRAERKNFVPIPLDAFEVIEDWRHYAILELMKLADFEPSLAYVARKLSISLPEARAYQERLERVGLLEIRADGTWADTTSGFSTHEVGPEFTSYAHKRSQLKTLRLAQRALEQVPIQSRDQSSIMMATNGKKLAVAKTMIRKFRLSLCEFLEDCEEKDSLYQLSVSLFPLLELANDGEEPRD